jgi:hypothetical protein
MGETLPLSLLLLERFHFSTMQMTHASFVSACLESAGMEASNAGGSPIALTPTITTTDSPNLMNALLDLLEVRHSENQYFQFFLI